MRLLITEKPSIARALRSILSGSLYDTDIVTTQSVGLFQFSSPNIDFSDIPATPTVEGKRFNSGLHPRGFFAWEHGNDEITGGMRTSEYLSELSSRPYTEIIIATDADSLGDFTGNELAQQFDAFHDAKITRMPLFNIISSEVIAAYQERKVLPDRGSRAAQIHGAKRLFDYWWRLNAEKVFGELCEWAGAISTTPLSKYEVMVLKHLHDARAPMSGDKILAWMNSPTPRHSGDPKYQGLSVMVGSSITHFTIVETLIRRGALEQCDSKKTYSLTQAGKNIIAGLHPRTHDPDLPFRIARWCRDAYDTPGEVESQMKRYIRQLFGRQLRYQRKNKLSINHPQQANST